VRWGDDGSQARQRGIRGNRHRDRQQHRNCGPRRGDRAALAADEQAGAFFGKLSNSLQRYHIDSITSAKSADTRQRRIDKAIALFRAGKQR
jgi:hypothetical protein